MILPPLPLCVRRQRQRFNQSCKRVLKLHRYKFCAAFLFVLYVFGKNRMHGIDAGSVKDFSQISLQSLE